MNDILSIKVEDNIDHTVRVQKNAQQLVLKTRRNEQNLERFIINEYPIFEMIIQMHGVYKFDSTIEWDTAAR